MKGAFFCPFHRLSAPVDGTTTQNAYGARWTQVAQLNKVTGLDVEAPLAQGKIIVSWAAGTPLSHRRWQRWKEEGSPMSIKAGITSFEDLFLTELSDIYSAEKQIAKALPRLIGAAANGELRDAMQIHLDETEEQARRIEQVADERGLVLKRQKCEAMEEILAENDEAILKIDDGPLLDVALIIGAHQVEHYEISAYSALIELARLLGYQVAEELLNESLEEERAADENLTRIAIGTVNREAQDFRLGSS